ncbi:hypothetical protein HEO31_017935, partial [Escherichia coli]|nr:hypothetical protein [Escherichia coli]
ILISESAWEEMTCLFAPSLVIGDYSISIFTYDIKSNFFEIRDNIGTENIFSSFSDFSSFLNEIMDSCS